MVNDLLKTVYFYSKKLWYLYFVKRITIFFLAILYISASTGVTLHMHYCMGQLNKMSIQKDDSAKCEFCGMKKSDKSNNGCCKDERKLIKSDVAQNTVKSLSLNLFSFAVEIPQLHHYLIDVLPSKQTEEFPLSNSPPAKPVPIYIANRSFLI